jgi:hypothetical protein
MRDFFTVSEVRKPRRFHKDWANLQLDSRRGRNTGG